jgi:hypothetical protein
VAAVVALGAISASASGATGGVYVVTPKSWGWCSYTGVHAVYYVNQTNGQSGGDAGDDIVWVPINLYQNNELTIAVKCNWGIGSSGTYVWIYPTRTGQAFYIGPGGYVWHN